MRRPNFFAGGGLDRSAHLRRDDGWLSEQLARGRIVPVWRERNLMLMGDAPGAVLLSYSQTEMWIDPARTVFLGMVGGEPHFALDLSHLDERDLAASFAAMGEFLDLRNTGGLLEPTQGNLLAYARGLMFWHARHRFCGVCGSPTESREAGHIRRCTNPDCRADHFPRTDPAVIMLVTDGERCLLGRSARFLPGMYSTLAGFVEPGESLEEAVAREVFEETGVRVDEVVYHSSQPWPFPASIMLGFYARATGTRLAIDRTELEDAVWKTRAELRASPEDETFRLPRGISIARRLIDDWLEEG